MNEETDLIEYRVRPVTRFIVTRFERSGGGCSMGGTGLGEFDNADKAHAVAYALCRADHERKGWPPGDRRIQYPTHPEMGEATPVEVDQKRRDELEAMIASGPKGQILPGPDRFPPR